MYVQCKVHICSKIESIQFLIYIYVHREHVKPDCATSMASNWGFSSECGLISNVMENAQRLKAIKIQNAC